MRYLPPACLSPSAPLLPPLLLSPQDADGVPMGVAGSVELLNHKNMSSQPISSFDWHPDKEGLYCCSAFDQCVRVGVVTKLNKV